MNIEYALLNTEYQKRKLFPVAICILEFLLYVRDGDFDLQVGFTLKH